MNKTPDNKVTLDQLLINLQKTLSRVSSETGKVSKEEACSTIYGDVSFSMNLNVENEEDKIIVVKDGGIKLSIDGKVNVDMREEIIDE